MQNNLPEFNITLKYKGKKSELKTIASSDDAAGAEVKRKYIYYSIDELLQQKENI